MNLTPTDFEILFDIKGATLPPAVTALIYEHDFEYSELSKEESNAIILQVLKKIDCADTPVSGECRKEQWESGWAENLQDFTGSGFDLLTLIPKYYRPNNMLRLNGRYIKSNSNTFEFDFFKILRHALYYKYFNDYQHLFEFGCGSGCNLPILAELFPNKTLYGLDWVQSSVDIVNQMRSEYNWNITGHLFNLFVPAYSLSIPDNSLFFTFGALEQLGSNYKAFVRFILTKTPALCVNVEPLCELYDSDDLLDYLAIKYHEKRGYLSNFLGYLRGLENQDKVEILDVSRMHFGGAFHDGWSRVVWAPK